MSKNYSCHTEISGKVFNTLFSNIKFVKLTNNTEFHNGLQIHDGINIYTNTFNHHGSINRIYFMEKEKAHNWFYYSSPIGGMKYIREVTIPDDACIYIEYGTFSTNKIILSPRREISKKDYIDTAISYSHSKPLYPISNIVEFLSKYVDSHDHESYLCLIKRWANKFISILNHIPMHMRNKHICLEAVKRNGSELEFVPDDIKDHDICMEAVKQIGNILKLVPKTIMNYEMCMEAVKKHGCSLEYVPSYIIDKKMCKEAIRNDSHASTFVPLIFKISILI